MLSRMIPYGFNCKNQLQNRLQSQISPKMNLDFFFLSSNHTISPSYVQSAAFHSRGKWYGNRWNIKKFNASVFWQQSWQKLTRILGSFDKRENWELIILSARISVEENMATFCLLVWWISVRILWIFLEVILVK